LGGWYYKSWKMYLRDRYIPTRMKIAPVIGLAQDSRGPGASRHLTFPRLRIVLYRRRSGGGPAGKTGTKKAAENRQLPTWQIKR